LSAAWREPAPVAASFADEPFAVCLLSDGEGVRGRWSYVAARPCATLTVGADHPADAFEAIKILLADARPARRDGPPFQGGVVGLASYELGERTERLGLGRNRPWPDLVCAKFERLLAFDHARRRVLAIAPDEAGATEALGWLDHAHSVGGVDGPLAAQLCEPDGALYEQAVAEVVERIAAGEIFQANLARAWKGRLAAERRPFDLFDRLARQSPAPFAAYLRLPGLALVSNSPERFLRIEATRAGLVAETRPIKGTVSRGRTPEEDDRLAAELAASMKDRAENLMIVDLMRNDLARAAAPASVRVPELFAVERFANVSHLVSTVTARLGAGLTAIDALRAAFPAGSITGAPKVQAMKVIAALEPPRGPFFGSIFWAGFDGAFDSSVLIRTVGFVEEAGGWRFEARAGGGIVADSLPAAERAETDAKIAAILGALTANPAPTPSVQAIKAPTGAF
jgi:para-aminobenzoate synthetase component 1